MDGDIEVAQVIFMRDRTDTWYSEKHMLVMELA